MIEPESNTDICFMALMILYERPHPAELKGSDHTQLAAQDDNFHETEHAVMPQKWESDDNVFLTNQKTTNDNFKRCINCKTYFDIRPVSSTILIVQNHALNGKAMTIYSDTTLHVRYYLTAPTTTINTDLKHKQHPEVQILRLQAINAYGTCQSSFTKGYKVMKVVWSPIATKIL